ncbi:hypothetical protein BGZ60DRAFT_78402 [Tricladium varicosporioides]|nr:hypothetical protein BGZ60DRAFT_78402 [Hymenoscyphus varicosporioides]
MDPISQTTLSFEVDDIAMSDGNYGGKGPLLLTDLPTEIQLAIFSLVCKHDGMIRPQHYCPGENIFTVNTPMTGCWSTWGGYYGSDSPRYRGRLPLELAAFHLARVNKSIRQMVHGENLFYKLNTFEFGDTTLMLKYLVSLPPEQRNAIKTIYTCWDHPWLDTDVGSAFKFLSACAGLREISIDINRLSTMFEPGGANFSRAPGFNELFLLRNLKVTLLYRKFGEFNLVDEVIGRAHLDPTEVEVRDMVVEEIFNLQDRINSVVNSAPGVGPLVTDHEIKEAAMGTNLISRDPQLN